MTAGPGGRRLRIGLSANYMAPDPDRTLLPHSWLLYAEQHMASMLAGTGALVYLVPPPVVASNAGAAAAVVVSHGHGHARRRGCRPRRPGPRRWC